MLGGDLQKGEGYNKTPGDEERAREQQLRHQGPCSSQGLQTLEGHAPRCRHCTLYWKEPNNSGGNTGSNSRTSSVTGALDLTHFRCSLTESSQRASKWQSQTWAVLLHTPSFTHLTELNPIATEHSSPTHTCLLGVCCVPLTGLGTWDISVNKGDRSLLSWN